jgi:membrane protein involved in colicin uptake
MKQLSEQGRGGTAILRNPNFDERRNAAEAAKKAKLEKFRALTALMNEGAAERQATRQAIVAARDVRAAERAAAQLDDETHAAEDQAAREIALKAEQAERDAKATEQAEREVASAAERKAARDARYAARKARK